MIVWRFFSLSLSRFFFLCLSLSLSLCFSPFLFFCSPNRRERALFSGLVALLYAPCSRSLAAKITGLRKTTWGYARPCDNNPYAASSPTAISFHLFIINFYVYLHLIPPPFPVPCPKFAIYICITLTPLLPPPNSLLFLSLLSCMHTMTYFQLRNNKKSALDLRKISTKMKFVHVFY